ncbi:MAG: hypothetical protein Q9218_000273 [Villophora microphyllina]
MPPLLPASAEDELSDILFDQQRNSHDRRLTASTTPPDSVVPSAESSSGPGQSRKRQRTAESIDKVAPDESLDPPAEPGLISPEATEKKHVSSSFIGVRLPPLICPKSLYVGHKPPLPRSKERHVLRDILEAERHGPDFEDDDFVYADLNNFSIYRPHEFLAPRSSTISDGTPQEKPRSNELVSLHELQDRGSNCFLFDGIICPEDNGQQHYYVQAIPFETLSIGAYENTGCHSVGSNIWIQSVAGKASNIWYRLREPATEYMRYHESFLWLADLSKHVIDFLHTHEQVKLADCKAHFAAWLQGVHGSNHSFVSWRSKHAKDDFRQALAAYATFLWNQAGQLGSRYASHPLWTEIDPAALNAVPRQLSKLKDGRTIVTPYVYECFSHMPWADFLNPLHRNYEHATVSGPASKNTDPSHMNLGQQQHDDASRAHSNPRTTSSEGQTQAGDIVAIPVDTDTKWKCNDKYWYAYIQGRKSTRQGQQLSLIWLYRPTDTACQNMRYPYPNELFMSDHCNCGDSPTYSTDVDHKVRVVLFGRPENTSVGLFVRQTYNTTDSYWVTLEAAHFRCECGQGLKVSQPSFNMGDTLLIRTASPNEVLQPVILEESIVSGDPGKVCVRRLFQRRDFCGDSDADANELVYTSRVDVCDASKLVRRCHIRFYASEDRRCGRIPAPYNRKGAGDCYYISWVQKQDHSSEVEEIRQPWPPMSQGFEPGSSTAHIPLRGLDIFCGGGNLGRGLEEAGAVSNKWAVDLFPEAIHTYHANADETMKFYHGDINDYLFQAMNAQGLGNIAQKGEVDCICAGNPCQGFSCANPNHSSERSLQNNSLVASVVSCVDFYRPKYLVMENVLGMTVSRSKNTAQDNVFAQVLCALVGLGYQVSPMILDAWTFGTPQSRTRLFITAAAPGLPSLAKPPSSHSHPASVVSRSLGKTANGLPFGAREWAPTPLEYVSIGEATRDLPQNPDGRTAVIPYPDHRVMRNQSFLNHVRLSCIPRFPPGLTFVKSVGLGWQPPPQIRDFHWTSELRSNPNMSKAWQRAKENALLPTVTTSNSPGEALTGSALHWEAHRCLTVMEARRAQGVPDDEVIVGLPSMQWKIIGNAVARQVAIALGLSLREAWLAGEHEKQGTTTHAATKIIGMENTAGIENLTSLRDSLQSGS